MNKYAQQVKFHLAVNHGGDDSLEHSQFKHSLREFLTLTDDEIKIIETEMVMDGGVLNNWEDTWIYWYENTRV